MTLDEALGVILPFGKHRGEALSVVSTHYIAWLDEQDWLRGPVREAVTLIMRQPSIQAELERGEDD